MSSVGHLFVGAAASRFALARSPGARTLIVAGILIGLSLAPDLDLALQPALGIPESFTLGHRGATHSLAVALAVALIVLLLALAVRLPARRVAIAAFVSIGSHAVLDSLTPGPGVAWLWPFSPVRFPTLEILPMAPVAHLLTASGLLLLVAELVLFSPFLVYALRRSDRRGG